MNINKISYQSPLYNITFSKNINKNENDHAQDPNSEHDDKYENGHADEQIKRHANKNFKSFDVFSKAIESSAKAKLKQNPKKPYEKTSELILPDGTKQTTTLYYSSKGKLKYQIIELTSQQKFTNDAIENKITKKFDADSNLIKQVITTKKTSKDRIDIESKEYNAQGLIEESASHQKTKEDGTIIGTETTVNYEDDSFDRIVYDKIQSEDGTITEDRYNFMDEDDNLVSRIVYTKETDGNAYYEEVEHQNKRLDCLKDDFKITVKQKDGSYKISNKITDYDPNAWFKTTTTEQTVFPDESMKRTTKRYDKNCKLIELQRDSLTKLENHQTKEESKIYNVRNNVEEIYQQSEKITFDSGIVQTMTCHFDDGELENKEITIEYPANDGTSISQKRFFAKDDSYEGKHVVIQKHRIDDVVEETTKIYDSNDKLINTLYIEL